MRAGALRLVLAALFLCTGCDPFVASGLAVDEEFTVPASEVQKIELLVPGRRLPPSARDVKMHVMHFQDTSLWVRFDADAAEAVAFAEGLVGKPLTRDEFVTMRARDGLDWWISPVELQQAERGRDVTVDGDGLPYLEIAIIRSGDTARVWLSTFTT